MGEFPAELLIIIFKQLFNPDLYEIAKLSRYLNDIATSILFQRFSTLDPSSSCLISLQPDIDDIGPPPLDALSVLLISRVSKIRHLYCRIRLTSPDGSILRGMRRLSRLLSHLSVVEAFTLNWVDNPTVAWYDHKHLLNFLKQLSALLDMVILKSCIRFSMHGTNAMAKYFQLQRRTGFAAFFDVFQRMVGTQLGLPSAQLIGPGWRYRSLVDSKIALMKCSPMALQRTQLTRISIRTKFLLVPPFSAWAFSMMTASPIESLTLEWENEMLSTDEYSAVFAQLGKALPKLSSLRFRSYDKNILSLLPKFLSRFPRLIFVDLSTSVTLTPGPSHATHTSYTLDNLTAITCIPWMMIPLMDHWRVLPKLQKVDFILRMHYLNYFDLEHFSQVIETLARLDTPVLDISAALMFDELRLKMVDEDFSKISDAVWSRWESMCWCITTVTINLPWSLTSSARFIPPVLLWLKLFPDLTKLSISCHTEISLDANSIRSICMRCPKISSFVLNYASQAIDRPSSDS